MGAVVHIGQAEWYANLGNDPQTGKSAKEAARHGQLTPRQQQAFELIALLNLNLPYLVRLRKKAYDNLLITLQNRSKQQINRMVQKLNSSPVKVEFISMLLYFCDRLVLLAP